MNEGRSSAALGKTMARDMISLNLALKTPRDILFSAEMRTAYAVFCKVLCPPIAIPPSKADFIHPN
jgi:hypothetical protein